MKHTIEEMHKLAAERKGYCLSETYVNNKIPLRWQCEHKHIWTTQPHKAKKHWCLKCKPFVKK